MILVRTTVVKEDENGTAEARRQEIKERVNEEPRLKPTRLLAQVRRSAPEEAYVAMSSDNALREMMRRPKKKILGNTLEILRKNETWHIDGTFKCAPALWEQCFVIGASVYHRMCICVWALMPGKKRSITMKFYIF
uniref:Uncharacterized protein n=1 Tax=Globodera pallida TaxID=36090 RepID=A0A183CH03_GLOPA